MLLTAAAALLLMIGAWSPRLSVTQQPPVAVFQLFQSPRWAMV